jgi:hypothetical protein
MAALLFDKIYFLEPNFFRILCAYAAHLAEARWPGGFCCRLLLVSALPDLARDDREHAFDERQVRMDDGESRRGYGHSSRMSRIDS